MGHLEIWAENTAHTHFPALKLAAISWLVVCLRCVLPAVWGWGNKKENSSLSTRSSTGCQIRLWRLGIWQKEHPPDFSLLFSQCVSIFPLKLCWVHICAHIFQHVMVTDFLTAENRYCKYILELGQINTSLTDYLCPHDYPGVESFQGNRITKH